MKFFGAILILLIFSLGIFNETIIAENQKEKPVKSKVKDNCPDPATTDCVVGGNNSGGGHTGKIANRKKSTKKIEGLDASMPDVPFDCPASHTSHEHFFIFTDEDGETGVGVIEGLLYMNESNPNDDFYIWIWESSEEFESYSAWADAMNTYGYVIE